MIQLQQISIHQGDFALRDVEFSVPSHEYAILMGPSGCGKTTLLEAICGLRPVTAGKILLDGEDVSSWKPALRRIGYVPQDAVLFPKMRVDSQIEFALESRKMKKRLRLERVNELAELLEITSLLRRYPKGLSGGEKQRVALARALSFRPRLLCLDEPLSALDQATKQKLTLLLKKVHQHEKVTALHITHNQPEARQLGTLTFEMTDGRVVRLNSATERETD